MLIITDRLHDTGKARAYAIIRRALPLDDAVGCTPHSLINLCFHTICKRTSYLLSKGCEHDTAYFDARPHHYFCIAVFAQYVSVNRARGDSYMFADERAKTSGVKNSAGTEHTARRKLRNSRRHVSHHIYRIGSHDQHSPRRCSDDLGNNLAEYSSIAL